MVGNIEYQVFDWQALTIFIPLGVAGVISWVIWLIRRTMSHRAGPISSTYDCSTSLVVPVFGEDPEILRQCLITWLAEPLDEVLIVLDGGDHDARAMLAAQTLPDQVRVIEFRHRGKRSALAVGIRAASGDVVFLSDSDTAWTPGLTTETLKGFADPLVGGVGTRQYVAAAQTSIWRRIAAWFLTIRYEDYVPAMAARGAAPCLSGRTVAYRRSVILPVVNQLEYEYFLGRLCIAGDDGRLTWLTLAQGYRTVYQPTAIAISMFPDTMRAFFKQRVRWGRNSYRCYLTAAWKGWLWEQPLITQLTVLQILFTPLTMGIALAFVAIGLIAHPMPYGLLLIGWLFGGRALRGFSHLREHPREIVILPAIVATTITLALPVKLFALITMNRQGWLTRTAQQHGGEGQTSASLVGQMIGEPGQ